MAKMAINGSNFLMAQTGGVYWYLIRKIYFD